MNYNTNQTQEHTHKTVSQEELHNALLKSLTDAKNFRLLAAQNAELLGVKNSLKRFQVSRLKQTHKDFLNSPDTQEATCFFLEELYNTKDLTQRDSQTEKLIPFILKVFPKQTLQIISKAFTLDALTERLDTQMANAIILDSGNNVTITEQEYKKYCTKATTKHEREQQLNLVREVGLELCSVVKIPLISQVLKTMRIPAKIANLLEIHNFLERGFNTFKNTNNPEFFVTNIYSREMDVLQSYY